MDTKEARVAVVIKQKGKPPLVFRGERFEADTPDGALGQLVPRVGVLSWEQICAVNGKELPLNSEYQLNPGDKLVVRVK